MRIRIRIHLPQTRKTHARLQNLIETAHNYTGYRALQNRDSIFGAQTGHSNAVWSGSFIDVCLREAGIEGQPSFADSTPALAYYIRTARLVETPRPGDIVFYSYGQVTYGAARVGIVSDVQGWKTYGSFKAIDGETDSGLPRGPQSQDGVYERVRQNTDVLSFVRLDLRTKTRELDIEKIVPGVRLSNIQYGKLHAQIELVQVSLAQVTTLRDCVRGKYDAKTRSAMRQFQREQGYGSESTGLPDAQTLSALAAKTGQFKFEG